MNEESKFTETSCVDNPNAEPTQNTPQPLTRSGPTIIFMPPDDQINDPASITAAKRVVDDDIIDMDFLANLPQTQLTNDGGIIKYLDSEGPYDEFNNLLDINCLARVRLELRNESGKILTTQQKRYNINRINLFKTDSNDSHRGLIPAILSMKTGEISWFRITPEYYNPKAFEYVPPGATLYFRIQFLDFDIDKKDLTVDDWEQRIRAAKERGAEYLRKKDYKRAHQVMSRSAEFIKGFPKKIEAVATPEQMQLVAQYKVSLLNNFALCLMKLEEYKKAIDFLERVLKQDDKNVKAVYRKATCHLILNDIEEAERDFKRVLELDPEEKDSKQKLEIIAKRNEKYKKKEVQAFKNIFNTGRWCQEEEREEEQKKMKEKMERLSKKVEEMKVSKEEDVKEDLDSFEQNGEMKYSEQQLQDGVTIDFSDTWS